MAKKPPRRPAARTGGRPHRPVDTVARLRGVRQELLDWVGGEVSTATIDDDAMWDDIEHAVFIGAGVAGVSDPFSWTPDQTSKTLEILEAEEEDSPGYAAGSAGLKVLFDFLADSGRWRGRPEDLPEVQALANAANPMAAMLAVLENVPVDDAQEDAALADLPDITRVRSLVDFIGSGRPVTTNGSLLRADVPAAAAAIGAHTTGAFVMDDITLLRETYEIAEESQLITVGQTSVTLTPLARSWIAGEQTAEAMARAGIVHHRVNVVLTRPSPTPWRPSALTLFLPLVLGLVVDGSPQPAAKLTTLARVVLDDASDPIGPDEDAYVEAAAHAPLRALIGELAELGLMRLGEEVEVTPGLLRVVARAVAMTLTEAMDEMEEIAGYDVDRYEGFGGVDPFTSSVDPF